MELTQSIAQLTPLWSLTSEPLFVQKTANYVYSSTSDRPIILKLTLPWRHPPEKVLAEVEWVEFLAKNDVPVAAPIRSINNNLTEPIDDFTATAFEFAPGHPPTAAELTPDHFRDLGRLLGHLHNVTATYPEDANRHDWRGQVWPTLDRFRELPIDQTIPDELEKLAAQFETYPKTRDTYGMIHGDLHQENFFVTDSGQITLFDFDACCYHWFLYDFATTYLHSQEYCHAHGVSADHLLDSLLNGYHQQRPLDTADLPLFLRLRTLVWLSWATVQSRTRETDPIGRAWIERLYPWMQAKI